MSERLCCRCQGSGRVYEHVQDDTGEICLRCKGTGREREQTAEPPRDHTERCLCPDCREAIDKAIAARKTAEPPQPYGIEYCPTCGKQVRASDNRVPGPFDVWYHAGCLAEPAPPQTAEPPQTCPTCHGNREIAIEAGDATWGEPCPNCKPAEPAPPAAPLEAEILRVINLLPSVTHGPITEMKDVPFAIRDLQEAYKDASRSRNAMNEKRLEAEIAALRSMFRDALTHHWPHNENPLEKCIYCEAALATGNTQKSVRDPVESISGE